MITYLWFKVLSVASHYLFLSFQQLPNTISKKTMHLLRRSTNRSMPRSNASIAFDTEPLWWFHWVWTAYNTPHRAGSTKCRAKPWHWIFGLAVDVEAYSGIPHDFLRLVTMRCKNPFWFCLWSSYSQAKKRCSTSLGFNSYGTQFPCSWIIPISWLAFWNRSLRKLKIPAIEENMARKLTYSIESKFMMETHIR